MSFEAKEKEPKLSTEMQEILNRSLGEKNGKNVDDIFRYKYKIMNKLCANQDLLHTLHCEELAGNDDVINGDKYRNYCLFDYMKLPDFKDDVRNYICFEVNDNGAYNNLINKTITFRAVCHEDDCVTDWGISRQDLLASIIKNEFDWTNEFGMHYEKVNDVGRITDDGYYYREITYSIDEPNNNLNKNRYRF